MANDTLPLLFRNLVSDELSVALKGGNDIQLRPIRCLVAGADRSAVDHQAGAVEPAHGDQAAWHVFVTARQGNVSVVPLRTHHGFN